VKPGWRYHDGIGNAVLGNGVRASKKKDTENASNTLRPIKIVECDPIKSTSHYEFMQLHRRTLRLS